MNIFKFEFKRNIKSLIYWSIGTSAIIVFFMALFPSMKDMGMQELVGAKLDSLPPAILETFNFSSTTDFSNINDFLGYCLHYILNQYQGVKFFGVRYHQGLCTFVYS